VECWPTFQQLETAKIVLTLEKIYILKYQSVKGQDNFFKHQFMKNISQVLGITFHKTREVLNGRPDKN